jgi:hypothetical protein
MEMKNASLEELMEQINALKKEDDEKKKKLEKHLTESIESLKDKLSKFGFKGRVLLDFSGEKPLFKLSSHGKKPSSGKSRASMEVTDEQKNQIEKYLKNGNEDLSGYTARQLVVYCFDIGITSQSEIAKMFPLQQFVGHDGKIIGAVNLEKIKRGMIIK